MNKIKNKNPRVSIIIPVYNGSNYLKDAIESALFQTYNNIEIIVVNDGSTDDGATEKIAKSYEDKVRYFSKPNGGVSTALNLGIEKMTGDYFSWLSHDDKYKSNKIDEQLKYLESIDGDSVILYANYELIDEKNTRIGKTILDHDMLERKPIYGLLRGMINGITMLIPKKAFDIHGKFDEKLWCTQDYDMWFRMLRDFKFVHQPVVLSQTRIHSLQDTVLNPKVVSEGNHLWQRMIGEISDNKKIALEGDLMHFYIEMVKFLKNTPYHEALIYCADNLESSIQENNYDSTTSEHIIAFYNRLLLENQKRASAYLIENYTKSLIKKGEIDKVATLFKDILVGNVDEIGTADIKKLYISKLTVKKTRTRIMFCSGHWLTGGMERLMSVLFRQLKDDYEIFLITAYDGRKGMIPVPSYVTHIKMSNANYYDAFSQIALTYALSLDIDVIVGVMNLWQGQLDLYELCKGTRIKTIASNNEMYLYPYQNPDYYYLIKKRIKIFREVDAVLWPTNFSAAIYGLASNNSYLMPNPNSYGEKNLKHSSDGKTILAVGRFNDYIKRIDRILEAFSIVLKSKADAKLVLVGKCDRDIPIIPDEITTINDLIHRFNIPEKSITFVGEVQNVEKYYRKSSVLVVASRSEGFGMVITEAASYGVPVVCNTIPGLDDLVIDGYNGYMTKQDDIKSMATHILEILSNSKLREKLGNNSKKHVSKFDESTIGEKWKYLINILTTVSANSIHDKLISKIDYKIDDYCEFSKILFNELNSTISFHYQERVNRIANDKISFVSKIKRDIKKTKKSLADKGISSTSLTIAKILYSKLVK